MKYGTEFFAGRSDHVRQSAWIVASVIDDILHPHSLLDVGCGQGEWLEAFGLTDCCGLDIGAPDGDPFLRVDLTQPIDLERKYDMVLCLETGEHLPESAAGTLVDTLVRHGDHIVFSAATPGQDGYGHINCQPHIYWHSKFLERDYLVVDDIRPIIEADERVKPWYRRNIFRYERRT
jgi:hypothetical protein